MEIMSNLVRKSTERERETERRELRCATNQLLQHLRTNIQSYHYNNFEIILLHEKCRLCGRTFTNI